MKFISILFFVLCLCNPFFVSAELGTHPKTLDAFLEVSDYSNKFYNLPVNQMRNGNRFSFKETQIQFLRNYLKNKYVAGPNGGGGVYENTKPNKLNVVFHKANDFVYWNETNNEFQILNAEEFLESEAVQKASDFYDDFFITEKFYPISNILLGPNGGGGAY